MINKFTKARKMRELQASSVQRKFELVKTLGRNFPGPKYFNNLLPKWGPWLPFSQARIISYENIWMIYPLQFHFQFEFGYELTTVFCSSWIANESVAIHTGCGKDVNQIEGTSWPEPLKIESKYFCFDPGYKIFGKYLHISNVKFTVNCCEDKIIVF